MGDCGLLFGKWCEQWCVIQIFRHQYSQFEIQSRWVEHISSNCLFFNRFDFGVGYSYIVLQVPIRIPPYNNNLPAMIKKVSRASAKKEQKLKPVQDFSSKHLTQKQVSIVLFYHDQPDQMIPNRFVGINSDDQIDLPKLVESLKSQSFLREDCSISYLSLFPEHREQQIYVYCGDTTKLNEATNIPATAINKDNQLRLKIRKNKRPLVDNLLEEQRRNGEREVGEDRGSKQKEKRIGEVVEKVALWRRFYTGFYDEKGTFIQKPLELAAAEVGIAKKTLDDYLLQIRCGKKYGFNFNEFVNGKIGELRAFVREAKKHEKKDQKE